MARRKKDFDLATSSRAELARLRKAAWAQLWKDAKYVKLHASAQKALHEWNMLDAYKNTPSREPNKLRLADARAKRLAQDLYMYEDAWIADFVATHS